MFPSIFLDSALERLFALRGGFALSSHKLRGGVSIERKA